MRRKFIALATFATVALVFTALAAAVAFGGPEPIAPLASINDPFARVDFSTVPPASRYTARDGTALAWLRYPAAGIATGNAAAARRVVLVHGSSARARSLHVLAGALAATGLDVAVLDMRGHGDSGPRGHAAYIGQLEDDIEDFMRAIPHAGPTTLAGFSSGGGFVLRFAGSTRQDLFDRYVLLAPFLHHNAPTNMPNNGGWVSVGLPRMIAVTLLNVAGISTWNHLPVLRFGLNDAARQFLTPSYDFTLATNFRPHDDYQADIRNAKRPMRVVAGRSDELFDASKYAAAFEAAGRVVPVTLVEGSTHMGLTLDSAAVQVVARAFVP
ncbi:alpha/beta hydrolase [Polaromonas sp.]|uniref:alpha/beta hydrolase n=1 Tax=Polaromonas sp. TaxID=1869339 RepID=UPI0027322333|nr:alpha/beta fold hydrolase [Polaromonas sp.]MDP1742579.1 alpha/beta fold hydrolase [Polaromonas sp.]